MINRFMRFTSFIFVLIILSVSPSYSVEVAKIQTGSRVDTHLQLLKVELNSEREAVEAGELLNFDIKLSNLSTNSILSRVRLINILPINFIFKKGSALLNGIAAPDPTISTDARALTFTVGDLAVAASSTIHFLVEIKNCKALCKVVNVASAFGSDAVKSNLSKTIIFVKPSNPSPQSAPQLKTINIENKPEILIQSSLKKSIEKETLIDKSSKPLPIEPVEAKKEINPFIPKSFEVSETHDLVKLSGKSEIQVIADVDGKYVKNMNDSAVLKDILADKLAESNLFESIRAGRNFSRESLVALARTEQAKAQTGQVFASLMPSVSLHANSGLEISEPSVSVDGNGTPLSKDAHSRTDASFTLRQPLFDLPVYRDFRRREIIEKVREESYRVTDGDAYISAVNAYLALVSSRLQTDMIREFETQLNELLIYVEKRAKAGAASNSDMARVKARSQATLSSRLEQESAHAAAGIEFIRLTNLVPQKVRIPLLDDVGLPLLPQSLDIAVADALKFNPEIASITAELQAAEMDKTAAKARYFPRVEAEYTYNYALHSGGDTSAAGQKDQRLMAVLNWNLFSGGADYKIQLERTARHKELQYRLDDQRRRVIQTLSASYATLATTRERITSGYQELNSISTAAEAMSKRMLSGNQSLLDLLDVYDRFYQVRSRLVTLHILEMSTVAQLVRLTHGTPQSAYEIAI